MQKFTRLLILLLICGATAARAQSAVTRPQANTGVGFFTKEGRIYDPEGTEFVPMGYNTSVFWGGDEACKRENMSTHIPNSGANAVRIVTQTQGEFGWNANPTDQRDLVDRAVKAKLVPMLEMHDATCDDDQFQDIVNYWLSAPMVQLCQDYEAQLWVNIANEHNFPTHEAWRDTYISVIKQFRAAGIKNLIVVDAGENCGQNPTMFTRYGQEVIDADPQQNVLFSVHMYGFWRTADRTFVDWTPPYSVENTLPALRAAGLPIIVGEFGWDAPKGTANNFTGAVLLDTCAAYNIGWYYWSFFDGTDKPFYSVLTSVCNGIDPTRRTLAGSYLIPYLQANARRAGGFPTDAVSPGAGPTLFPNPTTGHVTLSGLGGGPVRVEIVTPQGQRVRSLLLRTDALDVSDLAAGVYVVRVNGRVFRLVKG